MIRARSGFAGVVLVASLAASAVAQDGDAPELTAEEASLVTLQADPNPCYVGQTVTVRVQFEIEQSFFKRRLVPLFQRELDLPLQVQVDWGAAAEQESLVITRARGPHAAPTTVFDEEVVRAARLPVRQSGGLAFVAYELVQSVRTMAAGRFETAGATLRLAYGTRFREDVLLGRTALDRTEIVRTSGPLVLDVRPLPEDGRPASFTGAIGALTMAAATTTTSITPGERLELVVTLAGAENLPHFAPPQISGASGWHVLGALDDRGRETRTVRYELELLDEGATQIPALALACFEPGPPAAYRVVRTAPIPLEVHGLDGELVTNVRVIQPATEPTSATSPAIDPSLWTNPWFITTTLLAFGSAVVLILRRIRKLEQAAADEHSAAEACRALLADPDGDIVEALVTYLGERLECPPAAVVSPDLRDRLVAAGFPDAISARTAGAVESLVASRYRGDGAAVTITAADVGEIVDELERTTA